MDEPRQPPPSFHSQAPPPPPPPPPRSPLSNDERSLGMAAHLTGLVGFLGPLVVWLVKKDEMPFVDDQGKEALNWQLSVMIYGLICLPLCIILIGFFLLIALSIANIIFIIIGSITAYDGRYYRYPLCLRLIK